MNIDFFLYPATLLIFFFFYEFKQFGDGDFKVFYVWNHILHRCWQFYFSNFSFSFPKFSFPHLIALVRTLNTMLNKSSKSEHPCLVPDLGEDGFRFSLSNMMWGMSLSFTVLKYDSSISTLLRVFIIKKKKTICQSSSASIEMIIWTIFNLLIWCIILICGYWTFLVSLGLSLLDHGMDDSFNILLNLIY